MSLFGIPLPYFVLAVLVGIGAVARLTRLLVSDSFPPVLWFKEKVWDKFTGPETRLSNWWVLVNCMWCSAPWIALFIGGWLAIDIALDRFIDWPWWAFCGWMTASYVAAMIVFHDEGQTDEG